MLLEGNGFTTSFVDHPICSNFKMYSVLIFWFASINRKCISKIQFFKKILLLHEGSSIIASLVEHPVYNIFKMQSVLSWFWLFYFDLLIFTKSVCIKGIFYCGLFLRISDQHWLLKFHILYSFLLKISLAPPKRNMLLFAWPILYIVLSRYSVS